MVEVFQVIAILLGVMVQILIINWYMIFPMCVMLFLHMNIKNIYLATGQSVKRLEGNGKYKEKVSHQLNFDNHELRIVKRITL